MPESPIELRLAGKAWEALGADFRERLFGHLDTRVARRGSGYSVIVEDAPDFVIRAVAAELRWLNKTHPDPYVREVCDAGAREVGRRAPWLRSWASISDRDETTG